MVPRTDELISQAGELSSFEGDRGNPLGSGPRGGIGPGQVWGDLAGVCPPSNLAASPPKTQIPTPPLQDPASHSSNPAAPSPPCRKASSPAAQHDRFAILSPRAASTAWIVGWLTVRPRGTAVRQVRVFG